MYNFNNYFKNFKDNIKLNCNVRLEVQADACTRTTLNPPPSPFKHLHNTISCNKPMKLSFFILLGFIRHQKCFRIIVIDIRSISLKMHIKVCHSSAIRTFLVRSENFSIMFYFHFTI